MAVERRSVAHGSVQRTQRSLTASAADRNASYWPLTARLCAPYTESSSVGASSRATVGADGEPAPPGGDVYIDNHPFRAMGPIFVHSAAFPGSAAVFVIFFPDNVVEGRPVHFVEPDQRYFAPALSGRRSATLLVQSAPFRRRLSAR